MLKRKPSLKDKIMEKAKEEEVRRAIKEAELGGIEDIVKLKVVRKSKPEKRNK